MHSFQERMSPHQVLLWIFMLALLVPTFATGKRTSAADEVKQRAFSNRVHVGFPIRDVNSSFRSPEEVKESLRTIHENTDKVKGTRRKKGKKSLRVSEAGDEERFSIAWYGPFVGDVITPLPEDVLYDSEDADAQLAADLIRQTLPAVTSVMARSIRVRDPPPDPDDEILSFGLWSYDDYGIEEFAHEDWFVELQRQDFLVNVVLLPDTHPDCEAGALAGAWPYVFEMPSRRPVFGYIDICPSTFLGHADLELETLVHEMIHALGFVGWMFPYFQGAGDNGKVWAVDDLGTPYVTTAQVQNFVRAHFNCSEMLGAPLEQAGGGGTAGSHWEDGLFHGLMMLGADKGRGNYNRLSMTDLTLALFQDSGWYDVMYNSGGFDPYGYKSGCALPLGTWEEAQSDPASSMYVCDPLDVCTIADLKSQCINDTYASAAGGDDDYEAYYDYDCINELLSECNGHQCVADFSGSGRCIDIADGQNEDILYKVEKLWGPSTIDCQSTPGERCFKATGNPTCAQMSCENGTVLMGGQPCEGAGCPDAFMMCVDPGLLMCTGDLNDCSGHGDCFQGRCLCHTGWGGSDCSVQICKDTCDDGTPCPQSGFCGVPTCGAWSTGMQGMGTPCFSDSFL